ncbi:MAG: hypothetical protein GY765_33645 [bacterium]|nr:hypothetical protein [bacterium]
MKLPPDPRMEAQVAMNADTRTADTRTAVTRTAVTRTAVTRTADTRTADTRTADTRAVMLSRKESSPSVPTTGDNQGRFIELSKGKRSNPKNATGSYSPLENIESGMPISMPPTPHSATNADKKKGGTNVKKGGTNVKKKKSIVGTATTPPTIC